MKNIDLTPIIEAVVALIATVITVFIIPKVTTLLKEKLSEQQRKSLSELVSVAVKAAEQIYGSKTGVQKYEYVTAYLASKGISVDTNEVAAMIESEVYKLTQSITTTEDKTNIS